MKNNWNTHLFKADNFKAASELSVILKEQLIELSSDSSLRLILNGNVFSASGQMSWWIWTTKWISSFLILLPFINTELVDRVFFSCTYIKNKYRLKLNANLVLRLATFELDFKKLSKSKQRHVTVNYLDMCCKLVHFFQVTLLK